MRGAWLMAAVCTLCSRGWGQAREGIVAQLEIRGDLDSRAMGDEIWGWFARRDASREALAVVVIDSERARADLLGRVVEAIAGCPVPVWVYVDRGERVAPGVLAMMVAAEGAAVGRGAKLAGDEGWSLPGLCEPVESGWRGRYEALCGEQLKAKGLPGLLLDVMGRPVGDVFVEGTESGPALVRARNDAEAVQLVSRTDDEHWRVELDRETLIILRVADEADGIGQVLRLGGVKAFKRERTEVRSRLGEARGEAGRIREELRVRLVRMERRFGEFKRAPAHERDEILASLRGELEDSERMSVRLVELVSEHPEVLRTVPTWGAVLGEDAGEHQRRWVREVAELGEELDELRVELEAIDER